MVTSFGRTVGNGIGDPRAQRRFGGGVFGQQSVELRAAAARQLVAHGFQVLGWSRSPKALEVVDSAGHGFATVLDQLAALDVVLRMTGAIARLRGRGELS